MWSQGIFIYKTIEGFVGLDYLILATVILIFVLHNAKKFNLILVFILISFIILEFLLCILILGADQLYLGLELNQSIFIDIIDFLETQSKVSGCVGDDVPKKSLGGVKSFFGVDWASPTPPPEPSILWKSVIDSAKFPSDVSRSLNKGTELLESATKILSDQHKEGYLEEK